MAPTGLEATDVSNECMTVTFLWDFLKVRHAITRMLEWKMESSSQFTNTDTLTKFGELQKAIFNGNKITDSMCTCF